MTLLLPDSSALRSVPARRAVKRVLFVDDEPLVLGGLQRMLWPMRLELGAEFVGSGAEALERLARESFDVIVCDLRMPGINGAELLGLVRSRWPSVIRVTLTGESNTGAWMKILPVAHRFLCKPCPPELLRNTILRACDLRDLLDSAELRSIANGLSGIPSLPALYREVVRELEKPEPSMNAVAAIIARDVGMTARLMQVANSPVFGRHWPAANIGQAVVVLGADLTRNLVLAGGLFSGFSAEAEECFQLRELWDHCRRTAELARGIVETWNTDRRMAQDAATAGFLHEVGRLVYAAAVPERYAGVLGRAGKSSAALLAAETAEFGATHAAIGAYVLGLWDIPETVIEAVAWHHPTDGTEIIGPSALAAVQIADELLDAHDEQREPALDDFAAAATPEQLDEWRILVPKLMAKRK